MYVPNTLAEANKDTKFNKLHYWSQYNNEHEEIFGVAKLIMGMQCKHVLISSRLTFEVHYKLEAFLVLLNLWASQVNLHCLVLWGHVCMTAKKRSGPSKPVSKYAMNMCKRFTFSWGVRIYTVGVKEKKLLSIPLKFYGY